MELPPNLLQSVSFLCQYPESVKAAEPERAQVITQNSGQVKILI